MKGWFGNRQQHGLASKGIRSSYRRFTGNMLSKDETWELREQFIRNFGYFDVSEFEKWVLDSTDKTPFHSEFHREGHAKMMAFGETKVDKNNLVDYIIEYESGNLEEEDMIKLFAYLVKTGEAWKLQGHYGRTAKTLIDYKYIDNDGNITSEKYGGKPIVKKASKDKDLQELYDNLWDVVDYNGKEFTQTFYSGSSYSTEKYPMRSKEIIWEDGDGNQIYLFEDNIEYIPFSGKRYERWDVNRNVHPEYKGVNQ